MQQGHIFGWKRCDTNPLTNLDKRICVSEGKRNKVQLKPVRIELDNSLVEKFNELSEDELKLVFGTFTPVQSLNPYMTKLSFCTITQETFLKKLTVKK